jgi:perosamine synthetase
MKKELLKIPLFKVFMSPKVISPLSAVLKSGYIGQGNVVEKFEKQLSNFIKNPFILTLNSGTSALQLALRLADVGSGDEVISTPMTCTATNWPILASGAKIVWADVNPKNGNIDPNSIKKLISTKTKAILVVDWGGYPCDIKKIKKIAGKIPIIEDAAHAFGSKYKKMMVGQMADFTCFSFQAIKHLTAGDGGALAVKSKKNYERGKLLRWYGIDRESRSQENRIEVDVKEWGYKFHMNDINATIGSENLKYISKILKKHRDNASYYRRYLRDLKNIELLEEDTDFLSSYWIFTILVKNRNDFLKYMNGKGIMVSQVHRRNDTHPTVSQFKRNLPGVDKFTERMICIPVGWWLTTKERDYIIKNILKFDALGKN